MRRKPFMQSKRYFVVYVLQKKSMSTLGIENQIIKNVTIEGIHPFLWVTREENELNNNARIVTGCAYRHELILINWKELNEDEWILAGTQWPVRRYECGGEKQ